MAAFPRPTFDTFAFRQALAEYYRDHQECTLLFYEMSSDQVSSILRRAQAIKKELQQNATARGRHRLRRLL